MKKVIIPKKLILVKEEPIRHFFKCDDGFMVRNLRFKIHIAKHNPKGKKLHIQIWLPFIHIRRDNSQWVIGNRYCFWIFH
jgi:hypothetical protein